MPTTCVPRSNSVLVYDIMQVECRINTETPSKSVHNICLAMHVPMPPTAERELQVNTNKYAIHAYTHGPVTGSGPSVVEPLSVTVV